jgi:hypothetical protein
MAKIYLLNFPDNFPKFENQFDSSYWASPKDVVLDIEVLVPHLPSDEG